MERFRLDIYTINGIESKTFGFHDIGKAKMVGSYHFKERNEVYKVKLWDCYIEEPKPNVLNSEGLVMVLN